MPAQPAPTQVGGKSLSSIRTGLKLKDTLGLGKQSFVAAPAQAPTNNAEYTMESFLAAWVSFKHQIPSLTRIHYLFSKTPAIKDHVIRLEVPGNLAAQEIKNIEPQLLDYLHKNLHNDHIRLELAVDESLPQRLAAGNKEKLKAMAGKNPSVSSLMSDWELFFE
ncbi:MAG: hypothetical protein J6Y77_03285 [Paludibacteraceae bacterium]|nr:hypothetical protein [Paludibacteraceae bacterium]